MIFPIDNPISGLRRSFSDSDLKKRADIAEIEFPLEPLPLEETESLVLKHARAALERNRVVLSEKNYEDLLKAEYEGLLLAFSITNFEALKACEVNIEKYSKISYFWASQLDVKREVLDLCQAYLSQNPEKVITDNLIRKFISENLNKART